MKTVCYSLLLTIFFLSSVLAQQWSNPENQMLSNTMTGFLHYAAQDPASFSNPNSLREANRHGLISDRYHDELDYAREQAARQQFIQNFIIQQQYNDYQYQRYRSFRY